LPPQRSQGLPAVSRFRSDRMPDSLSYQSNPYLAFPLGFGDMKSQRAVARVFAEPENAWRFVRLEAIAYSSSIKKEIERGGSLDRIFPGITESLGRLPDPEASWLYRVTSFLVKDPDPQNRILIPAHDDSIHADWFDDFHAALDNCFALYGVRPSDFGKA